jgi:hypothetical protein
VARHRHDCWCGISAVVEMTTAAWDGETLAVDSRLSDGNDVIVTERAKKLFKVGDKWIATSGAREQGLMFVQWMKDGQPADKRPVLDDFRALVKIGNRCYRYEQKCVAMQCVGKAAIGGGYEIALTAMACGKTAREAVRMAAKFNCATNGRIQATP